MSQNDWLTSAFTLSIVARSWPNDNEYTRNLLKLCEIKVAGDSALSRLVE